MHHLFTAAVSAGVVAALAWWFSRLKPRELGLDGGVITPERWTAAFTVVGGLVFATVGLLALGQGSWPAGLACGAMGLAIAGFMAPSLTDLHNVRWTAVGVNGPARMFGPTLALSRTEIAWPDIVRTGKTLTGYWFIQAEDGRRIYWSYLYRGYGAFVSALNSHCPSLSLPSDLG